MKYKICLRIWRKKYEGVLQFEAQTLEADWLCWNLTPAGYTSPQYGLEHAT